jgi:DNA-binding FadR family transcriptional regulator
MAVSIGAAAAGLAMGDQSSVLRLFSHVVGDAQATLKCAGRTARLLEEQFIADGWPVGQIYGCETTLSERYGVGRAVVRESARILEARGTARMRRGRHGGLELMAPSIAQLRDTISGYCYLINVSRDHIQSARLILDRVAAYMATERCAHFEFAPLLERSLVAGPNPGIEFRRLLNAAAGNAVLTFYSDCLEQLRDIASGTENSSIQTRRTVGGLGKCIDRLVMAISRGDAHAAAAWAGACSRRIQAPRMHVESEARKLSQSSGALRDILHRTRAGQIVQDLMRRVGPGQWTDGRVLGNEMDLCDRYRVDRGVLRQAIRILEAAETAVSVPGRGHGLVARSPGPAAVSRLICCHFAASRVGHYESFLAFKWLGVEMVALAARGARTQDLEPVRAQVAALARRTDTVRFSDLISVEERQFALACNPVLELFLRSAKAFPSLIMHGNLPVPQQVLGEFLESSEEVTAAIAARRPVAAAAAQERKFMRLKGNFDKLFVNFRSGSLGVGRE